MFTIARAVAAVSAVALAATFAMFSPDRESIVGCPHPTTRPARPRI